MEESKIRTRLELRRETAEEPPCADSGDSEGRKEP